MTEFLTTPQNRTIAHDLTSAAEGTPADRPGVVFLGGFRSDKEGSKAIHLEAWARARGLGFLRFDYSGHGQSSERFEDGCIGDWAEDALAAIQMLTRGPQILVGSSMGGWISLLIARDRPELVAGLVTIAAAPDFTTRAWEEELDDDARAEVMLHGFHAVPSDYSPEPYIFTRRLFEDGAERRVMDRALPLDFPVRLLQGTADTDVLPEVATRLLDHASGEDIRLLMVKGADHRFSTPDCLNIITDAIEDVLVRHHARAAQSGF